MRNVLAAYYNLINKIEATLTSYTRIPNPYETSENPSLFLRKGYGLGFSNGENTNRQICDKFSVRRSFTLVLINQVFSTEMNSSGRASFERSLMEDHYAIINAIEKDVNLGGKVSQVSYQNDSGIDYVENDTEKFILISSTFDIEYLETIT
jgi:hypothetical protein